MCTSTTRPATSVLNTVHRFPKGGLETSATNSIPGTPRRRPSRALKYARALAGVYPRRAGSIEITCWYSKPGEVYIAWFMARASSPATMSSTQLAATCAPIRNCRMTVARWRCRAACQAGVSPNRIAAAKPMPMAKAMTRPIGGGGGAPPGEGARRHPRGAAGQNPMAEGEGYAPPIRRWIDPCRNFGPYHQEPQDNVAQGRSEEHTSELQSPCNLVCRLLLEK